MTMADERGRVIPCERSGGAQLEQGYIARWLAANMRLLAYEVIILIKEHQRHYHHYTKPGRSS